MYKIVTRKQLNDAVVLMEIDAPYIAAKAEAGQFIIYRVDEKGERVPLTIADYDREKGTITIIFQVVGASTTELARLNEGDYIHDVVGPLGVATEYDEGIKRVAVVGGGVGCAIAYPQAKKLHNMGVEVDLRRLQKQGYRYPRGRNGQGFFTSSYLYRRRFIRLSRICYKQASGAY